MENLKTGDIILFCGRSDGWIQYFSDLIKYATHSNYSHVGMIVKDPDFISPGLKGTFVWESGWEGIPDPQDGIVKLGVQLTPLNEMLKTYEGSKVIVRKLNCPDNLFTKSKLKQIHDVVYLRPYDINPYDWIQAFFRSDINPRKTDRFWCSALVGYIYTECGILNANTDWSILRPSDFSLDGEDLNYNEGCSLDNSVTRIA